MSDQTTPTAKLEVYYQHEIGRAISALTFIQQNRELLEKAGDCRPCLWGDEVDFDGLKRPDVLKLLKAFGGKWDKSPSYDGGHLQYTRREQVNGRTIRLSGEPPASCKIVETVRYEKVPARRERIVTRKVVCK